MTDATGRFALAMPSDSVALALLVRRIGFRPVRIDLARSSEPLVITLVAVPQRLASIAVRVEPPRCPRRDDRAARLLYQRAASRYDVSLTAHGVLGRGMSFVADVSSDSLGVVDTSRLRPLTVAGGIRAPWLPTRNTFYGSPAGGVIQPRYDRWEYPWLESVFAWHFADARFDEWNDLALDRETDGMPRIVFCSRRTGSTFIVGVLELTPDTAFASASWRFVVPDQYEEAGGEVFFAPVRAGPPAAVIPMSGRYWRRRGSRYYVETVEYREWIRCDADCSPPLR
ncbi:MAG TPA: hypothetical protein VNL98_06885 [Gemmatimonadales bacterium]|nr:hypothetical protein [Gemmatimonadales bacterium]